MGRRAAHETVIQLVGALLRQRRWIQSDLARELEVEVRTRRKYLEELRRVDPRLERRVEGNVAVWQVPRGWAPLAIPLEPREVGRWLRALALTLGPGREALLEKLQQLLPAEQRYAALREVVLVPSLDAREEHAFGVLLEAAQARQPVRMRYHSVARGELHERVVSPHRLAVDGALRLLATCHRDGALKWFRLSAMEEPVVHPRERYREADAGALERKLRTSVDGFSAGEPEWIEFAVRRARWAAVARALPQRVREEELRFEEEWVHARLETAGVKLWARHLLGLGEGVRVPEGALREAMKAMLREAIDALAEE